MSSIVDFRIALELRFYAACAHCRCSGRAACAVLSCYLVLKGWSLMGDAVSHAVLPGIVIAFVLGLPFSFGRVRCRFCLCRRHGLYQREQPREGGHGHGDRLLRHVWVRARALHQG